jgi:NTP pyrophosphatase (non-canonical NTP hydrolase)
MDLRDFQRAAAETSQLRPGGPQAAIAPMLGLASETGSILNVYKKYLRDGIDLAANREFLREELGDLLWYLAAVATACGLDLEDIAAANLRRTCGEPATATAVSPVHAQQRACRSWTPTMCHRSASRAGLSWSSLSVRYDPGALPHR